MDKQEMVTACQRWAEACDGEVSNGDDVLVKVILDEPALELALHGADMQTFVIAGARWAVNGFPQVVTSATYAAALMATDVPADIAAQVEAPWNGFLIEVPSDLLTLLSFGDEPSEIRRILVTREPHRRFGYMSWAWAALSAGGTMLYRFGVSGDKLVTPKLEGVAHNEVSLFPLGVSDHDERCAALIGRLILGVCLAFKAQGRTPSMARPASHFKKRLRGAPPPTGRTYRLGTPTRVDCRPAVKAYLESRRHAPPSVQHIVRGHWKQQPFGPGGSSRKTIWVEPYWRGPEDAPVLMKTHVMGKD